jgi:hypothetical protein
MEPIRHRDGKHFGQLTAVGDHTNSYVLYFSVLGKGSG